MFALNIPCSVGVFARRILQAVTNLKTAMHNKSLQLSASMRPVEKGCSPSNRRIIN